MAGINMKFPSTMINASSVVPTPTKNRRDMAMGVKTPEDTFSQMLSTSN